jgi:hypothetical protein
MELVQAQVILQLQTQAVAVVAVLMMALIDPVAQVVQA